MPDAAAHDSQKASATVSSGDDGRARIEAFLADRQAAPAPDLDGVMTKAADQLRELLRFDVVANDPICLSIVQEMPLADNPEVFAADVDRLQARVAHLLETLPPGRKVRRKAQNPAIARPETNSPPADSSAEKPRRERVILRL